MIILERMNQNHITQVYELELSCFAIPWSICSLYDQLLQPAACYFVALDCDKVVGYGGFVQVLDEGNINNIAVLPEYRQQKIGTEILEKLITEGNKLGVKDFFLEVRVSNEPAKTLYRNSGFREVGIRKAYYKDNNEDAIVMRKSMEEDD
ncbi:ribosomal protein S18-alanine N-acetyltransferase [Filifactor alocis]|uniref:ribosomal protein S18-alanine N-acetyltransferase n=1 Tax=Filifactor alocis TaxID=143361 RepID=UPI003C6F22A0